MAKAKVSARTFILELKTGDIRKITIPADWKITYGNVVPYQGKNSHSGEHRVALRLYAGNKENLRCVMTDVVAFRDSSMSVLEKRTEIQRKASTRQTAQGAKDVIIEARVTEWVNPDNEHETAIPNEFKQLSAPVEEINFDE